jgi:hypothetical protein
MREAAAFSCRISELVRGIAMPSTYDRAQIDRSGGDRAGRPHFVLKASPCVEILETRCLMSNLAWLGASPRSTSYRDAEYRPAISEIAAPAPTRLEEPAHASYLIVREQSTPHSTLASAQNLPDVPYFGVIGNLGSDNPIDVFEMNLGAGTAAIQFQLAAQQPAASTPVQLSLYDATGRVLGTWTSGAGGQPGALPITLELPSQLLSPSLYLGISALSPSGNGPAGSVSTTDYQLWVSRLTTPELHPTDGTNGAIPPLPNSSSALVLGPFQPSSSVSSGQQAQAPLSISTAAGTGSGLALTAGFLPTRAAGPLGGAVASGNTIQQGGQSLIVTVNVKASDRSSLLPDLEPAVAQGSRAEPDQGEGLQGAVAIRGPGGFPLRGAAAIGQWRRTPREAAAVLVASAAEPAVSAEIDALATDQLASENLPPAAVAEPSADRAENAPGPLAGKSGESRLRLSLGLTVATFLTLNIWWTAGFPQLLEEQE